MSSADAQLTIVVPFYTDNADLKPLLAELSKQLGEQRFSSLRRLLSRADREAVSQASVDALLCSLFKINIDQGIPYAALSWMADSGSQAPAGLLRFDPVHLQPDMEYVLLFDSRHFELGLNQARELVAVLNEFLKAEGWAIEAPSAERWYLRGVDSGATTYTPITEVVGENILPHMPAGELQDKWRQILNELQMLLHVQPLNERREQQGTYTINGVWPWGAAPLQQAGEHGIRVCYGDSALLQGLCLWGGVTHSTEVADILSSGKTLVYLRELHEYSVEALQAYLQQLEDDWLLPLADRLRKGQLTEVKLYIGTSCCYTITTKTGKRWWRRTQSLDSLVDNT